MRKGSLCSRAWTRREVPHMRRPALDRFADKIALTDSGCIEWIASRNNKGYGTFNAGGGKSTVAHRWS